MAAYIETKTLEMKNIVLVPHCFVQLKLDTSLDDRQMKALTTQSASLPNTNTFYEAYAFPGKPKESPSMQSS